MADKELLEQLRSQMDSIKADVPLADAPGEGRRSQRRQRSGEKDFSSPEDALAKIVALVNASDKSEATIRERLLQTGFYPQAAEEAIARAKSYGFIDDMRFADVLIRSRLSQGRGMQGISRELRSQGIEIDDVPGWPDEFEADAEAEYGRAVAFLEKHPPRSKNLREGAYRKLVGKGFSSSVASSAARSWLESTERA